MIITCPDCTKRYLADAETFAPRGRRVKCANCGHIWFQSYPEELAARSSDDNADYELHGDPYSDDPSTYAVQGRSFSAANVAGWMLLLIIVGGIGAGAFQYRHFVVREWPQSVTAYKQLGIETNVMGIAFKDVTTEQKLKDGMPTLAVRGKIVNISNRYVPIPRVRLSLFDGGGEEVYRWFHPLNVMRLSPDEDHVFESELLSPPVGVTDLRIDFDQDDREIPGLTQ
jgi:predicted Zn finger-like uncharacterized protein